MKTIALYTAASLLLMSLFSCETPQDQAIEQARQCVNGAAKLALSIPPDPTDAATQAQTCEQIITAANVTSAEGMKVKYGAILIEDQIIQNLVTAAQDLKTNPSNKAGLASMLPILLPTPIGAATKDAEATRITATANATGSPGMIYIASLISMAVTINDLSSLDGTPGTTQTVLTNCANTGGSGTIGSGQYAGQQCSDIVAPLFTSLASAACSSPYDQTSTSPTDLCYQSKQITQAAQAAAGGGTPTNAQITAALAAYLSNPPH